MFHVAYFFSVGWNTHNTWFTCVHCKMFSSCFVLFFFRCYFIICHIYFQSKERVHPIHFQCTIKEIDMAKFARVLSNNWCINFVFFCCCNITLKYLSKTIILQCLIFNRMNILFYFMLQLTLSSQDFSLQFHPALSTDTAEYYCLVNDRHSPEAIIDLLVQGKILKNIWSIENHSMWTNEWICI